MILTRLTCVAALLAAASASSFARPDPRAIGSNPERTRCYQAAADSGMTRQKAIRLCIGATSDAPARCVEEAIDRIGLSDEYAIGLCRVAESTAPATCARRLAGIGLSDRELVRYCRALSWPLVPAQTAGDPACVRAGLDRTTLGTREAVRLCRGSASLAPIECFERGDEVTSLGAKDLVDLCVPVRVSAPIVVRPR